MTKGFRAGRIHGVRTLGTKDVRDMSEENIPDDVGDLPDFLVNGGEMGALILSIDWSKTPIGPISQWSQALRTTVGMMLRARFPFILWWGPQFIQIYNDPYMPIPGDKHPKSMGQPASECWKEIWHIIGPMIKAPFRGGPATWSDDLLLVINRKGFMEETHWKVSYSPIPDPFAPSGIGGVLATVADTTEQVFGERQLRTLRELGARTAEARTSEEACRAAAQKLVENSRDVPFALFFLLEPEGKRMRLAASCGFDTIGPANPQSMDIGDPPWPLTRVVENYETQIISGLSERFTDLPKGGGFRTPNSAIALPLSVPDQPRVYGVLIAGISPHREFSDGYRTFFELAASQATTAIRNARAYEEAQNRAKALAEVDRAKTAFFSNVSHEFRTPLTLMLGPMADALSSPDRALRGTDLETVHRSALRLHKLVNSLLDFSRIEARRIEANFEPTDLSSLTADLASVLRAAIEKAGLSLVVDCPPLEEEVYVDRDMWEKIVFNLISNAFKFTFEGGITVSLRKTARKVKLSIRDTGIGIAEGELPRLFERFHRIKDARARTYEGTGIGLALVQELVKLHRGTIDVSSKEGKGTTFHIRIPLGHEHLPPAQAGTPRAREKSSMGAIPYVEEALRRLPDTPGKAEALIEPSILSESRPQATGNESGFKPGRVLLVDENDDMRQYLGQLLKQHWSVETAPDGVTALEIARTDPPDLVLSDIMMPGLDGFELLKTLREDPLTREIPVILLSARAGEEARVEGIAAGADDYLSKPFSARELRARVSTHLKLARIRREAKMAVYESEERLRSIIENSHDGINMLDLKTGRYVLMSPAQVKMTGFTAEELKNISAEKVYARIHPEDREPAVSQHKIVADGQIPTSCVEYRWKVKSGEYRWFSDSRSLVRDAEGRPAALVCVCRDITERKRAEEELRQSRANLELRVKERTAELEKANAELRQLPSRLIEAQEEERKRLASELHDSIGQTLAALKFRVEFILNSLRMGKAEEGLKATEDFVPTLQRSIEETRAIYMGLRPRMLEDFGVIAALRWYRDELLRLYPKLHIEVDVNIEEDEIRKDLHIPIFRIAQEALNNICKHSKAGWVEVSLSLDGNGIQLTVSDDGIGMDVGEIIQSSTARSLGLSGMKERTQLTGGNFTIESTPGEGTTIRACWPM
jgi:PAS domain S-box-containing protein